MKKLKTILQHNILYYVVLLIAIIFYLISNNLEYITIYDEFNSEEFIITNLTIYDYGLKLNLKGNEKVIGYLYTKEENETNKLLKTYSIGNKVLITGKRKDITNNTVPNTFNYKKYLSNNKIYNVIEITKIEKIKSKTSIFYKAKDKLLQRGKKLNKSYPYINSLLFGVNTYLDEEVMTSYRENGISHLFAISGLHISVFIYLISTILDKLKTHQLVKSIIIISFLLFYMFLTNFSMSVLRGAIFTCFLLLNKLFTLEINNINLLLLTLSIILFINPLNLNNVGLQYSFLVSLCLLKYTNLIKGNKLKQMLIVSSIAFLVSYPITVNNFYQVNFLSILYNLVFVPYVSFILLPFTLISYVFPGLDDFLFLLIKIIESLSQFLNTINIGKISMCKISTAFIVLYFVIICKLLNSKNKKRVKYLVFLIVFLLINYLSPLKKDNYIIFLDVGQGDSSLININNNVTMIDTGGIVSHDNKEYRYKISKNKLIPYLKSVGIKKINNLILTHGDFDHMGEAKYLVENFKVKNVIFNCGEYNDLEKDLIKVLDRKNIKYQSCISKLDIGDTELKFLQTREYDNENDNSNVIYTEKNNKKYLFMGDAGIDKEKDILEKYNISNVDVLKVGHHGSNTSSSEEFIDEVNPKYSVISVGKNNRYGHPNEEVLNTLGNSKIYRTDQDGSIMFKIRNNKLKIETCSP